MVGERIHGIDECGQSPTVVPVVSSTNAARSTRLLRFEVRRVPSGIECDGRERRSFRILIMALLVCRETSFRGTRKQTMDDNTPPVSARSSWGGRDRNSPQTGQGASQDCCFDPGRLRPSRRNCVWTVSARAATTAAWLWRLPGMATRHLQPRQLTPQ